MPLRRVRLVKGDNRNRVKASMRHINALLAYNAKQPDGSYILSSQVTALTTAVGVLDALLAAVRFV